jgi:hypothetical protein
MTSMSWKKVSSLGSSLSPYRERVGFPDRWEEPEGHAQGLGAYHGDMHLTEPK